MNLVTIKIRLSQILLIIVNEYLNLKLPHFVKINFFGSKWNTYLIVHIILFSFIINTFNICYFFKVRTPSKNTCISLFIFKLTRLTISFQNLTI